MNSELVVTVFDGDEGASAAYKALQQLAQSDSISILDAATIVKHNDGAAQIKDSQDVDVRHGAYVGVISGALIGLAAGPVGALIGSVAGAATGATAASLIDLGFPKKDLELLSSELDPGSSALVVLVELAWLDRLDAALASFDGRSARRTVHGKRGTRIADAADTLTQQLAELRLEDEQVWARTLEQFDADLDRMNSQLAQESRLLSAELAAEDKAEARLTALRDQRDAKRQELNQKINARIDRLNAAIKQQQTALSDAATKAGDTVDGRIASLQLALEAARQRQEASWHAQQAEWQHDIEALKARVGQADDAARARYDAQIAALEATRLAAKQEHERHKLAEAAAVQDLKVGAGEAHSDLRQAREKAAGEFKQQVNANWGNELRRPAQSESAREFLCARFVLNDAKILKARVGAGSATMVGTDYTNHKEPRRVLVYAKRVVLPTLDRPC